MKKLISGLLSVVMLVGLGAVLYHRLQPSMKNTNSSSKAETVRPALPANAPVEASDAAERLPPDAAQKEGGYAVVNQERLQQLAGQPYNGPSFKEDYAGAQREMLAARNKVKDRLPASNENDEKNAKKAPKNPKK